MRASERESLDGLVEESAETKRLSTELHEALSQPPSEKKPLRLTLPAPPPIPTELLEGTG
jgi:hypothetical protein